MNDRAPETCCVPDGSDENDVRDPDPARGLHVYHGTEISGRGELHPMVFYDVESALRSKSSIEIAHVGAGGCVIAENAWIRGGPAVWGPRHFCLCVCHLAVHAVLTFSWTGLVGRLKRMVIAVDPAAVEYFEHVHLGHTVHSASFSPWQVACGPDK